MASNRKKMVFFIGAIILVSAILLGWFYKTQTSWLESAPYHRASQQPAKVLVVVYSRTGNTFGAATTVARRFDADLLQIRAPQYSLDLKGQNLASKHANEQVTTTPISHKPVNIAQYDLVFLFSPTWWFRPAVPLWSFVENHDFAGKKVILIMTGNSRRKSELTDNFSTLVEQKNGVFINSFFIRRGRVFWQKTPEQVNTEVLEVLKKAPNRPAHLG